MYMRSFIFLALVGTLILASLGCNSHPSVPPGDLGAIPFELTVPPNVPAGDYHAVSGISIENGLTRVGDTILEAPGRSFYAEFYPANDAPMPRGILLNGNPLERNLQSDTFRLESASNSTPSIFNENIWSFIDTTGDTVDFPTIMLDPIDSIAPFSSGVMVRGDTSLKLTWKPSSVGSGGIYLTWEAPGSTYTEFIQDFGLYVVKPSTLKELLGTGTVTLTRFRNDTHLYNGRNVVLTRLAQRVYTVTVQP